MMPRSTLILTILFILYLLVGCGRNYELSEGMGEVEVVSDPDAFPSVVMVIAPGGRGLCSGTIISPYAVLTAAHCTLRQGRYRVISNFGSFSTDEYVSLGPANVADTSDMSVLIFEEPIAERKKGQVSPLASFAEQGEKVRLVGFGCDDLDLRKGAGVKRTGVNLIVDISNFIELHSPYRPAEVQEANIRGILGPYDRAATCFGDSGGPLFKTNDTILSVVGVCHAGGHNSEKVFSEFININRPENIGFLHTVDKQYDLGVFDICDPDDPMPAPTCGSRSASVQIVDFLKRVAVWAKQIWIALISWLGL